VLVAALVFWFPVSGSSPGARAGGSGSSGSGIPVVSYLRSRRGGPSASVGHAVDIGLHPVFDLNKCRGTGVCPTSEPCHGGSSGCGGDQKLRAPEPENHRRFYCFRCGRVVVVRRRCDRGQRYCGIECRSQARSEYVREAGRRYCQRTPRGRRANAERQRRHRERRTPDVTHHGPGFPADQARSSKERRDGPALKGVLSSRLETAVLVATNHIRSCSSVSAEQNCGYCDLPCGQFALFHFLVPRRPRRGRGLSRDR